MSPGSKPFAYLKLVLHATTLSASTYVQLDSRKIFQLEDLTVIDAAIQRLVILV